MAPQVALVLNKFSQLLFLHLSALYADQMRLCVCAAAFSLHLAEVSAPVVFEAEVRMLLSE